MPWIPGSLQHPAALPSEPVRGLFELDPRSGSGHHPRQHRHSGTFLRVRRVLQDSIQTHIISYNTKYSILHDASRTTRTCCRSQFETKTSFGAIDEGPSAKRRGKKKSLCCCGAHLENQKRQAALCLQEMQHAYIGSEISLEMLTMMQSLLNDASTEL